MAESEEIKEGNLTPVELGIKHPIAATARSIGFILNGVGAAVDPDQKQRLANLISDRATAAHKDFVHEAIQTLTGQVLILEALITRHVVLLSASSTSEDIALSFDMILRAQGELRKTLLVIDQIRSPKKTTQFIKSYVHQQLNQLKTDLLEATHEQPIPLSASERPAAIISDSHLEAVGEIDRTQVNSRKGKGRSKRLQG